MYTQYKKKQKTLQSTCNNKYCYDVMLTSLEEADMEEGGSSTRTRYQLSSCRLKAQQRRPGEMASKEREYLLGSVVFITAVRLIVMLSNASRLSTNCT